MRPLRIIAAICTLGLATILSPVKVFGQEGEKATQPDTTKRVVINNYYYGGPLYPYPAAYPFYPPFYGSYYPRVFVSFVAVAPFHHRVFVPRFHRFRAFGHFRPFGQFRSPGVRTGGGRVRY